MSNVKDHTARPRFGQDGIQLAVREQDGKLLREHVGVNIPRPHLLQDQVGVGPVRAGPEIEHHRHVGQLAAFLGAVHGGPGLVQRIRGLLGPVVRRLHSHNDVGKLLDRGRAELRVHLVDGLLEAAVHTIGDNVKKSQHSHPGVVDDFHLFLEESLGARGSRVHDRRHSRVQRDVRGNAQRRGEASALPAQTN